MFLGSMAMWKISRGYIYITWYILHGVYIYITWYILHVKYPEGIYIYTYILYYIYIHDCVFFTLKFLFSHGISYGHSPWALVVAWAAGAHGPDGPGGFPAALSNSTFLVFGGNNIMIILWIIIGLLKFINKNWIIIFIALLLD